MSRSLSASIQDDEREVEGRRGARGMPQARVSSPERIHARTASAPAARASSHASAACSFGPRRMPASSPTTWKPFGLEGAVEARPPPGRFRSRRAAAAGLGRAARAGLRRAAARGGGSTSAAGSTRARRPDCERRTARAVAAAKPAGSWAELVEEPPRFSSASRVAAWTRSARTGSPDQRSEDREEIGEPVAV